jgi:hypothetical protein
MLERRICVFFYPCCCPVVQSFVFSKHEVSCSLKLKNVITEKKEQIQHGTITLLPFLFLKYRMIIESLLSGEIGNKSTY